MAKFDYNNIKNISISYILFKTIISKCHNKKTSTSAPNLVSRQTINKTKRANYCFLSKLLLCLKILKVNP